MASAAAISANIGRAFSHARASTSAGVSGSPANASHVIVNLIVDLTGVSFETPDESMTLTASGVQLVNRQGASPDDLRWIRNTFHGKWHEEAAAGWNWFARGSLEVAGFAAYGQHSIKYWWLDNWWERPDIGIFGPMGVDPKLRGMRLGVVLARRALGSLQAMGYAQALIPAAGPIEFYERHCGARVIERLPRRL
jgi:hypothetical protein